MSDEAEGGWRDESYVIIPQACRPHDPDPHSRATLDRFKHGICIVRGGGRVSVSRNSHTLSLTAIFVVVVVVPRSENIPSVSPRYRHQDRLREC